MQRKNSILKNTHKNGIAMIMALSVIIIIATIMALSLSLTTTTVKKTTDLYFYEQATILAHSAAEYAILEASLNALGPCSYAGDNFSHNGIYDINISMQYVSSSGTRCRTNAPVGNALHYATTTTPESDGTVVMDITVSVDPSLTKEPVRYFRRSIQKL